MTDSTRLFSLRSDNYAQFRPTYPDSLFRWLGEHSPATGIAVDVAAGSGQATLPLSEYFDRVIACDASPEQLTANSQWNGALRLAARADQLPLPDGLADVLVVAQALHWFATPRFFAEAKRVLAPDGLFCAWCYSLLHIEPALDALIARLHGEALDGHWPAGRASVDAGYRDITPPFETISVPAFAIEASWDLPQLLGYLRTWSAVKHWQQVQGRDPVAELEPELKRAWGNPAIERQVRWPLHFIAGYPGR